MNKLFFLLTCGLAGSAAWSAELTSGIDRMAFDRNVRVQDDLFRHVNGEWLKHTPIPEDKSNYGSFIVLIDEAQANLRAIIEEAAERENAAGTEAQKIGDFYKSYMNETRIDELGLGPLEEELTRIRGIASKLAVVEQFGYFETIGVGSPIAFYVDQDDKNSTQYLATVRQSGTTLPDRDYYLKDDDKYVQARDALKAHIRRLFELARIADGDQAAEAILKIETRLAEAQWTRTHLRDANKRYNKYAVTQLSEDMETLHWPAYFSAVGAAELQEVNVMTPSFFTGLIAVLDETPIDQWRQYLQFHLIDASAPFLSSPYVDAHFELHQKQLAGIPQQLPRWRRAVRATAGERGFGVLGDAVGKLYVERHFDAESKARMDQLVSNLLLAYRDSIDDLTWMTPTTKEKAQEKLAKITTKIGYTDKWRDYTRLEIRPDDLWGNMKRSARVEHQRMVDKLGKPVDRTEWGMTPQTVNAYYNPSMNEIVFPAAILQPPFFNVQADDAVNYGGIGSVIGHEISHAFDDQGSKYDGDGNLNNWWTDRDRSSFTQLTRRLIDQYAAYEPLAGKRVNGELTLGENIADLSGMSIALQAYRASLQDAAGPVLDDWTGEQRFFIGWGQIWRRKYRDAEMVRRLLVDPHSPSAYRANGPVTNIDAFYDAFDVQPGDQLYKSKTERIRIW